MNFELYQRCKASVIIDGQYGSTGKGLLAGYIALNSRYPRGGVVHTTNAAPNAGHTVRWGDGEGGEKQMITYHLPTGALLRNELSYINAGAIIDLALFNKERETAEEVFGHRMMIQAHPNAALLLPKDAAYEKLEGTGTAAISSTQKGVGAALARKIRREALVARDHKKIDRESDLHINEQDFNTALMKGLSVSIEVPQGMSLGLNHGKFYPFCTSREVSVAQALSDANIHPRFLGHVALSMRTFPIRVGSLAGTTSGGHYYDQKEISWSDIGLEPELTTVTKRPRRLFTWSRAQYRDALLKAIPAVVFLNFCNYFRSEKEFTSHVADMMVDHDEVGVKPMILYGLGPAVEDVYDDPVYAMRRFLELKNLM